MKLTIVPTPVGNLSDITLRALETLKNVDLILAEDTRVTAKLLSHYEIKTPMRSFHSHNEHRSIEPIINKINAGQEIALVSDAGTPGISDPGFLLSRACWEAGIEITCLPGATAIIPAAVMSGLPTDRFVFEGFLPHKKGRQKRILAWVEEHRTIVFYESPYRIMKCFDQMIELLGPDREIAVCREISKKFEEVVRGTIEEAKVHFEANAPKGEFVLVLAGAKS
tara:strand:- start:26 stop:697 length:672 start_codon:yes stop_codon:yes gene_type:complete